MKNNEIRDLCLSLAYADSEDEVVNILKESGLWDSSKNWMTYGENENNFSTIGNQQSSPDSALVEKIINSVDAVLMRECLVRGITPDGPNAPKSITQAQKEFFSINEGKLANLDPFVRTELAKNIILVATGKKSNPCYSIIDLGEGQSPNKMPQTFLSLHKSNKLRIPFVQGKFNMGGTGSLQFCGRQNIQLIISKRMVGSPSSSDDDSAGGWGFTVVRREDPKEGIRSSTFKYLAPDKKILRFDAKSLPLLPGDYPKAYSNNLENGTFIKLYEYQISGLKTNILFDLYNRLSILLPKIALPVRIVERRRGYSGHTMETTLSGLMTRLDEDKRDNLESGFPSSSKIMVDGQEMKVSIYAFKKDSREKYAKDEGIIFEVNGQAHGFISKYFYERKSVGMSYLSNSILVTVDCSNTSGRTREDLFMNSRDRLREGRLKTDIEKQLEEIVKNHQGLKDLRERRRREEVENKLEDSKPLAQIIETIIRKSPSLSKLFIQGIRIINPFNLEKAKVKSEYLGKKFPTFFKLKKEYLVACPKMCPINRRFRVQYETDANNDYFDRNEEPGEFVITLKGMEIKDYAINLWNGTANLNVALPEGAKKGDIIQYIVRVNDVSRAEPFINDFYVRVDDEANNSGGGGNNRRPPSDNEEGEDGEKPSSLSLPNIIKVSKEEWNKYGFTEKTALCVKDTGENSYDFYLNIDNIFLLSEMKDKIKTNPQLIQSQFEYGLVLIGLSLLNYYNNLPENAQDNGSVYKLISNVAEAIAPMLLPMIGSLGELSVEE